MIFFLDLWIQKFVSFCVFYKNDFRKFLLFIFTNHNYILPSTDRRVTPGKIRPESKLGVTSSLRPSECWKKAKIFIAPTSVISSSGPNNHNACWQLCWAAICYRNVNKQLIYLIEYSVIKKIPQYNGTPAYGIFG